MSAELSKSGKVTIVEVAKAAGVDRSTVSRAYNQPEMLRQATIEKVKSVAVALGYSPNTAARALRTGQVQNIALIVPDLTNPFMPPIALAAQKQAEKTGYCVFIGNADENPGHEERLLARFSDQVSGAILVSPRSDEAVIRDIAKRIPLVLINRDISSIPRVLIDAGRGMAMAVEHLAKQGHARLAYISGPTQSWANEQRCQAVFKAANRHGVQCLEIAAGTASFASGMKLIDELVATGASAFLAFDDVLAQGVYFGLAERGFSVPSDFSLVGCDDVSGLPVLTTVSSQTIQAGRLATELLIKTLKSGTTPDICELLDTELILRKTTDKAISKM